MDSNVQDLNETSADDEEKGADEEKLGADVEKLGANVEKGAGEKKGSGPLAGPLAGMLDHAKYITKSLDNTITTLLKLKEGIQDTSVKIKQSQETLAKSIEVLKDKVSNFAASSDGKVANNIEALEKAANERVYSLGKRAEGSRISQAEEQAKGKGSVSAT